MKILKLLPFLVLLLLAGCRSSQSVMEGTSKGQVKSQAAFIEKVIDNEQKAKAVTAKMNLELKASKKEISVGGKLRMKRDEIIQMSLSVLGFEVGRMEFTPQHVLIVDRVNKQFVKADYGHLTFLQLANLDFHTLQALFWNELFIPGESDVKSNMSRFHFGESGEFVELKLTDAPKLQYAFLTQLQQAIVKSVSVTGKRSSRGVKVEWSYDKFDQLDRRYFPTFMQCQILGLDKEIGFSLSLSRLNNDDNWSSETRLSSRYTERSIEEVLQQLMGM